MWYFFKILGKIKGGLVLLIRMDGFNGIVDIIWKDDLVMMKGK